MSRRILSRSGRGSNGEVSLIEKRAFRTPLEVSLESTGLHFVDEIEGPRAKLDIEALACMRVIVSEAIGCRAHRDSREEGKDGGDGQVSQTLLYKRLLSVWGGETAQVPIRVGP